MELTQERVRELFNYCEDGRLTRRVAVAMAKAGDAVGTLSKTGYLVVSVDRRLYYVHRIIFMWHNGWLPPTVDHRDTDKLNNRIDNLRSATTPQNGANKKLTRANASGVKGVHRHSDGKKWCAQIKGAGKHIHLGLFETKDAAAAAYAEAAQRLHGEFART